MDVWGFGFHYGQKKSMYNAFIRNNYVAVGYNEDEAPEFIAMMKEINIGDIVYLKSWVIKGSELRIYAIGVVTKKYYFDDTVEDKNRIGVEWVVTDRKALDELRIESLNTKYRQRVTSIYKEYNDDVLKEIVRVYSKYQKGE